MYDSVRLIALQRNEIKQEIILSLRISSQKTQGFQHKKNVESYIIKIIKMIKGKNIYILDFKAAFTADG